MSNAPLPDTLHSMLTSPINKPGMISLSNILQSTQIQSRSLTLNRLVTRQVLIGNLIHTRSSPTSNNNERLTNYNLHQPLDASNILDDPLNETPVVSLSFGLRSESPLAAGDDHGRLRLISSNSSLYHNPPSLDVWQAHRDSILSLCWNDSSHLLSCAEDLRSWNVEKRALVNSYTGGHSASIKTICVPLSGTFGEQWLVVSGGRDGRLCLWDLCSNGSRGPVTIINAAHTPNFINSVLPLPYSKAPNTTDYTLVSSGAGDSVIRVWDIRRPFYSSNNLGARPVAWYCPQMCFRGTLMSSTQSTPVFPSGSSPCHCQLQSNNRGASSGITSLTTDSKREVMAALDISGRTVFYNIYGWNSNKPRVANGPLSSFYSGAALSPDGLFLIRGVGSVRDNNGFAALLYDLDTLDNCETSPDVDPIGSFGGHSKPVTCVAWNNCDIGSIATGSDDGTVRQWNLRSAVSAKFSSSPTHQKIQESSSNNLLTQTTLTQHWKRSSLHR